MGHDLQLEKCCSRAQYLGWRQKLQCEGKISISQVRQGASQVVLVVKNLLANARDLREAGSIPGLGRSPEEGLGNPLQYSCLKNPLDRGAGQAIVHGITDSDMTEWLSTHTSKIVGRESGKQSCFYKVPRGRDQSKVTERSKRKNRMRTWVSRIQGQMEVSRKRKITIICYHMWNLEYADELILKHVWDRLTDMKINLWLPKGERWWGRDKLGVWD